VQQIRKVAQENCRKSISRSGGARSNGLPPTSDVRVPNVAQHRAWVLKEILRGNELQELSYAQKQHDRSHGCKQLISH